MGGGVFGITATAQQRRDLVTEAEIVHPFTQGDDFTRSFKAEDVTGTWGRGVEAIALQNIGTVDAGGGDFDQTSPSCGWGMARSVKVSTSAPLPSAISMQRMESGRELVMELVTL